MDAIGAFFVQSRDREGYPVASGTAIDSALAGAGLVEAVLHGKVTLTHGTVSLVDATSSGNVLVDSAVAQIGRGPGAKGIELLGIMARTFPESFTAFLENKEWCPPHGSASCWWSRPE